MEESFNSTKSQPRLKGRFVRATRAHQTEAANAALRKSLEESCCDLFEVDAELPPSEETDHLKCPLHGRRVIHLRSLAEALATCKNPECRQPLVLLDCAEEKLFGLASILTVPCRHCSYENAVYTDTTLEREVNKPGPRPFSSNRKAALGKFFCRDL